MGSVDPAGEKVNVALLLKPESRSAEGIARVRKIVADLGLEVTGAGAATVSVKASPKLCRSLFGLTAVRIGERPPDASDLGAPRGHEGAGVAAIPESLEQLVESISIVPPARRLR